MHVFCVLDSLLSAIPNGVCCTALHCTARTPHFDQPLAHTRTRTTYTSSFASDGPVRSVCHNPLAQQNQYNARSAAHTTRIERHDTCQGAWCHVRCQNECQRSDTTQHTTHGHTLLHVHAHVRTTTQTNKTNRGQSSKATHRRKRIHRGTIDY